MIFSSWRFLQKTNDFTTTKPQVDLFSLVFWRKLKARKRRFEINWPLGYIAENCIKLSGFWFSKVEIVGTRPKLCFVSYYSVYHFLIGFKLDFVNFDPQPLDKVYI